MSYNETLAVSKDGRITLPKSWRVEAGLAKGGVVEIRTSGDGQHSIVLTPQSPKRQGAIGLVKHFAACPFPINAPERY